MFDDYSANITDLRECALAVISDIDVQETTIHKLESKLDTAISALKKLRQMDTWQNVKQINDFLDETLKELECQ